MSSRVQKVEFQYESFDSRDELAQDEQELIAKAVEAAEMAYAPYSRFHVGAALRLSGGRIVIGS
ncbi:MAG TPA: cytidine deaminase, partial [Flavobacteriales bacterium]|nr:cytidine deaminase [Flavobacteriales bacterium]